MKNKNLIDYRVGKALTPNKSGKTEIISFLHILPHAWQIYLIVRNSIYEYSLDKTINLSDAQKKTNMVSSLFVGKDSVQWISLDDLGI
jgi:choline kinase